MAKLTPVYYLESGQVKFWQESSSIASATVITPNAIVAKKQSLASISYDPYKKQTVVAVYKGEAEVADLGTGKKFLLKPTDDGKPRVAIISFNSSSPAQESKQALPGQSNLGFNISVLVAAGVAIAVLGYLIIKKKSYLLGLYNKVKQKFKKHE